MRVKVRSSASHEVLTGLARCAWQSLAVVPDRGGLHVRAFIHTYKFHQAVADKVGATMCGTWALAIEPFRRVRRRGSVRT